jgi:hypothetical protein
MKTKILTALAMTCLTAFPGVAQDADPAPVAASVETVETSEWSYSLTPFLWATGMSGTISNGPITVNADLSFSTILENLDMGMFLDFRARNGSWEYGGNLVYADLSTSTKGPIAGSKHKIGMKSTVLEADVKYYYSDQVFAYGGARYYDISSTLNLGAPLSRKVSVSKAWVDPIVGGGFAVPMSEKWSFVGKGDVGGFGIGSDFAWQAQAYVQYESSDTISILAGYRHLNFDYTGGGTRIELTMSGPVFGVRFNF